MTVQQQAIERLIDKKLKFCPSGECECGYNLCEKLDLDDPYPITSCPRCKISYVE
jgi:hypothetical protein